MIFAKLRIGPKMGLVFGFVLVMMLSIMYFGINGTSTVKGSMEGLINGEYQKTVYAFRASSSLEQLMVAVQKVVMVNDAGMVLRLKKELEDARASYRENLKNLEELEKDPRGIKLIDEAKSQSSVAAAANNRVVELALANKRDEALSLLLKEAAPLTKKVQDIFDAQVRFQEDTVKASYAKAVSVYERQRIMIFIAGALAFILGLAGAIFLIRNFVTRLNRVAGAMGRIADGDISTQIRIYARDEIGDLGHAINRMLSSLNAMVASIKSTADQVASAATQLYATSDQIATGAEEVAAQAGTVATASEEMTCTSSEIAKNCLLAVESSKLAGDSATSGFTVVQETVEEMNRIAERVKDSAQTVESLGARSDQIGEIVGTIEDIADQTNLLALNAAIEAARAGEQGRGFAVVADEVRALAERTTRATKEIGAMIKAIQSETRGAVSSMEEGVQAVEKGTADAARSGRALQEILEQANSVTMQINQIATATEQQTATTNEITNNIQQITDVVHETAKGSQESAAAANQLSQFAVELQQLVDNFKLAV
ncbi:MAG: methyl-accepting chemotaxis protein [Geobacteraceae bacterium]|nr:methyl-accepting chemotaxis protein [Geobacteraceae bacterium]